MKNTALAQEYISSREECYTNDIIALFKKTLKKENALTARRFHAKSHGLLEAVFTVNPDIAAPYRIGLFKSPGTYQAWVRFSNGSEHLSSPDFKKSVRGMSIKVLNTGESPIEADEFEHTQDFLLTNGKITFPGRVKLQGLALRVVFVSLIYIIPVLFSLKLRGLIKFIKGRILIANVLEQEYYSGTPYLFGYGNAVKWRATPLKSATSVMPADKDDDFLKKQLAHDLSDNDCYFELYAQLQQHAAKDPIEDAAKEWTSETFIKVATITLPKQNFDTTERDELDRKIKFNPWHAMKAHRPLGGVNRLRRRIYREMSAFRLSNDNNSDKIIHQPARGNYITQ